MLPGQLRSKLVLQLIELSLQEDLSGEAGLPEDFTALDVTSFATFPETSELTGEIFSRAAGVVAGLPVAAAVFKFVDPALLVEFSATDGEAVEPGDLLLTIKGSGRSLLLAERAALNFLGRMSGIATLTAKFVEAVAGTGAVILDTRKTVPGFRSLDKYAVRMGGGSNHRMGLYDMALIKDNHVDGSGGVAEAVDRVRKQFGDVLPVEVEVRDLEELQSALQMPVDRILLDNMKLDEMRRAVELTRGRVKLEASGNVNLSTVRAIAETGVDYISSGALTHSVQVFDVSMRLRLMDQN